MALALVLTPFLAEKRPMKGLFSAYTHPNTVKTVASHILPTSHGNTSTPILLNGLKQEYNEMSLKLQRKM